MRYLRILRIEKLKNRTFCIAPPANAGGSFVYRGVNYPPFARAEVGASGLRPSFFLPMLHRQAPVFHRLYLICRNFSEKSNFIRIFLQKMEFISLLIEERVFFLYA